MAATWYLHMIYIGKESSPTLISTLPQMLAQEPLSTLKRSLLSSFKIYVTHMLFFSHFYILFTLISWLLCLIKHIENWRTQKCANSATTSTTTTTFSEPVTWSLARVLLNRRHSYSLNVSDTLYTTVSLVVHVSRRHDRRPGPRVVRMVNVCPCRHSRRLATRRGRFSSIMAPCGCLLSQAKAQSTAERSLLVLRMC